MGSILGSTYLWAYRIGRLGAESLHPDGAGLKTKSVVYGFGFG